MKIPILYALAFLSLLGCEQSLPPFDVHNPNIRINQVGYYPNGPKKAVIVGEETFSDFVIVESATSKVVHEGALSAKKNWDIAGEIVQVADFSGFSKVGEYMLYIDDLGYSYAFEIKANVLREALIGSVRGLYYQRASTELPVEYAGEWHRAAGHLDTLVKFHPSLNKVGSLTSSKGWYDAGDYGKYVVNGAFPLGQLLLLHEQYGEQFNDGDLNIPESGNGRSDYLDELKYEMDWLLTMQDVDGGVFFKLTTERFGGMVLPQQATSERFVIGKGTSSSLDFAAVAAKFSRVSSSTDEAYAKRCLDAAERAWDWAVEHPSIAFKNPEGVATGEYGDTNFSQEFYWAAAELYVSTGKSMYLNYVFQSDIDFTFSPGDSWANFMHFLGAFVVIEHVDQQELVNSLKSKILSSADALVAKSTANDYYQAIDDFHWGSNSDVMNAAMIVSQAYRIDPKAAYLQMVHESVDYIFGKNATGYSFLTGFGDQTPQFIHHRQSAGDDVKEPVPGLLAGGPNSRLQDKNSGVNYPDSVSAMKSWVDQEPSFASNEICLNWNAPLTYVLGFIEQEAQK